MKAIELKDRTGLPRYTCVAKDVRSAIEQLIQCGVDKANGFIGLNFSGEDLRGLSVTDVNFSGCKFCASNLGGATFLRCCFVQTDFTNACLSKGTLESCFAACSNLRGVNLEGCVLTQTSFLASDLTKANLKEVYAERACFESATLKGAKLENGIFDFSEFKYAKLEEANLEGSSLLCTILEKEV